MHLRTQFILAAGALLSLVAAAHAAVAGPVVLSPRVITLPPNASQARFVDLNGDGRRSLLVMDPVAKRVLNYRQGPNGFDDTPGQVIPLPPQTAWIAACDVAAHPGLELLVSTATGVVYFRQNAGLFESAAQTLIEGSQVFTNFDFPFLTSLTTNVATQAGTNDLIPVISARQVVLYHRNKTYEWKPGAPVTLDVADTAWWVTRDPWGDPWTLGANPGHRWGMTRSFRPKQEENPAREPASEMVRKIVEDMEGNEAATQPETNRVDLNADGREDLVLWQVSGTLDCKTDIYLFLRGADQSLPERPTQILHCHGFPVPIRTGNRWSTWSPVGDLDGDGICELVLLEIKTRLTSVSGALETALSHGLDWSLTVRRFHDGGFSRSPDASVQVTAYLPAEVLRVWPFVIEGDFNGDGRCDFVVRRSDTQWNIFLSATHSKGREWFAPEPGVTFETPVHGYMEIDDLNGDGLSDVIWREPEEHRLSIFLSPRRRTTEGSR